MGRLAQLAVNPQGTSREEIYLAVASLYRIQGTGLNQRERALMHEILRRLTRDVEMAIRIALAERLADDTQAPHDLILLLVDDKIEVARPLLLRSPLLTEADMIKLIAESTKDHHEAVATRAHIGEPVTDALSQSPHEPVLVALVRNATARISTATYEALIEKSRSIAGLQEPLTKRPDLPPVLASRMCDFVSDALKTFITQNYRIAPERLEQAVEQAETSVKSEAAAPRTPPAESAQKLVEKLDLATIERLPRDQLRDELRLIMNQILASSDLPLNRIEREQMVEELLDEVTGLGPLEPLLADTTISDIMVNGFNTVYVERFGKLDILVNNAGITRDKMFHNLDDDLYDLVLDVNLKTGFHATLAAMPYLREVAKAEIAATGHWAYQRKITFTSSIVAFTGNPGQYNYTAAKGAIIATTKTLARELGPFGINVNAVAPGPIDTPLVQAMHPAAVRRAVLHHTPMRRYAAPDEVATAILFLLDSRQSSFITGAILPVDGGFIGAGLMELEVDLPEKD